MNQAPHPPSHRPQPTSLNVNAAITRARPRDDTSLNLAGGGRRSLSRGPSSSSSPRALTAGWRASPPPVGVVVWDVVWDVVGSASGVSYIHQPEDVVGAGGMPVLLHRTYIHRPNQWAAAFETWDVRTRARPVGHEVGGRAPVRGGVGEADAESVAVVS